MNIRYLKIFLAVVDNQTMNAAAKALNITQPSISQAISEMEYYYGVKLFDRLSRHLYLTPTGTQLLSYARYIVSTFNEMEVFLKNSAQTPLLRIGATAVFSSRFLSGIVKEVQKQHPSAALNIQGSSTPVIEEKLLNSELDLGIVEGKITHPDLVCQHLATDRLVFVCGRTHPFYGKQISFQDLNDQAFITYGGSSYLRNLFHHIAEEKGIRYQEFWTCSGSESIKTAVMDGLGLCITSASMFRSELASGALYEIPVEGMKLTREWMIAYHKNKFFHPMLLEFVRICQEYIGKQILEEANLQQCLLP
ncbi:LysR family transcriptional regulator [Hominifimenecus sp. rT4P-3]|uniref:LysR family transcriptional regulator n=1 Tax=Hominifimenecus sp. rT4P-3 TaxID=3242979 RepID=UPI003DA6B6A9